MRLLLETHIDPAVARELARLTPDLEVELAQRWRGGFLRTAPDDELLTAAVEDGLILVTFDVNTIPSLLTRRFEEHRSCPGVIFISTRTLRPNDVTGIARSLAALWKTQGAENWEGRIVYLA